MDTAPLERDFRSLLCSVRGVLHLISPLLGTSEGHPPAPSTPDVLQFPAVGLVGVILWKVGRMGNPKEQ